MSRLEKIKEAIQMSDKYADDSDWRMSDIVLSNLHETGHINWLIEQVEMKEQYKRQYEYCFEYIKKINDISEVEHINHLKEQAERVQEIEQQNKRYREAIEVAINLLVNIGDNTHSKMSAVSILNKALRRENKWNNTDK